MWRRILEQWSGAIGLNFDPSHLILQMIDIPRFIGEFGPHILHVQAKDLWIDREGLYERGVFSMGMGWQVPRLPGLGDVDWADLFGALWRTGYDGDVIVEHEDRDFEKTDELIKRFLKQMDLKDVSIGDLQVELNGNTLVVAYQIALSGTGSGQPLASTPAHQMSVWHQQKSGWVLIAHASRN
jgi:hypothetical protein